MVISVTRVRSDTRGALSAAGTRAVKRAVRAAFGADACATELRIKKDKLGKPLGFRGDTPIALSISHSYPFALGAVEKNTGRAVGADIERIRRFPDYVWEAFSTPAERAFVDRCAPQERARYQTLAWSIKESALKAGGVGLRMHPRHIDTAAALGTRGGPAILKIRGRFCRAELWQVTIGHTYVAAAIVLNKRDAMIIALPPQAASWNCAPSS